MDMHCFRFDDLGPVWGQRLNGHKRATGTALSRRYAAWPGRASVWLACVAFCFAADASRAPAQGADGALRTWSDASGKFKIKAKFVSAADGVVTLEQEDGSELEIELKRLNAADQKFVADALKAAADSPFKSKAKSSDPFKPKSKKTKPGREQTDDDTEPAETRTIKVDFAAAEQVLLGSPSEAWKVEVAKDASGGFGTKPKSCPLPPKTSFFEHFKGMAINPVAKKAVVGMIREDPGLDPQVTRIVICDLVTGKAGTPASMPGPMVPLALHDDGRQIVMCRNVFGFGNQDQLEICTVKGSQISRNVVWTPYDDAPYRPNRDVLWASFLGPDQLATSSRGGKVVIWKFPDIEPLCTFTLADGAVPALSPDRTLLAYCNGTDIGLFDVAKRQVLAQQAMPEKLTWPYLAFSPSGRRLGCVAFDKVLVWDVASGKLERTIPCAGINVNGGIEFPDESFVLANSTYLIDIENQLKLWTYQGADIVRSAAGWTFFGVAGDSRNGGGAVGAGQIPHPAARDLLKKALTDPNLFVLKAGTTVKLNLDGVPDPAQRERVQKALTKRLEGIQCKVGAQGSIELAAIMEGPKDREISFRRAGDYKMKEYVSRVRFVYQGQPAWESSSTNFPAFIIHLKQGENIESHLRSLEKPNYEFFDRVELPKFLQKPTTGQAAGGSLTLGQSRVTATGLQ